MAKSHRTIVALSKTASSSAAKSHVATAATTRPAVKLRPRELFVSKRAVMNDGSRTRILLSGDWDGGDEVRTSPPVRTVTRKAIGARSTGPWHRRCMHEMDKCHKNAAGTPIP